MKDPTPPAPSLLRNISWLAIANALTKPFWFVFVTALAMRILGVEQYGVMNAALSLSVIATSFTDLGMARYSVREVSQNRDHASKHFSNFMSLRATNAVLGWVGAVSAAWLLGYRQETLLAVVFAGIYVFSLELTNYCRSIFEAFEDLRTEAVMLVAEKVLVLAGGVTLLLSTRSAAWTLAGMAVGMVLATGANTVLISRRFAQWRVHLLDKQFIKSSLRAMLPFGIAGLLSNIYFRVDMVMIESMLGEGATGQYGAAFRILEALLMLPTLVATAAVYPRFARLHEEMRYGEFSRLLRRSTVGLVGFSVTIAGFLTLSADWVIRILDPSPEFGPAAEALRILAWAFPIYCANSLLYSALVTMGSEKYLAVLLGFAVIVNTGFNLLAIPAWGISGAAIATVIPEVLLVVLYSIHYRSRNQALQIGRSPS